MRIHCYIKSFALIAFLVIATGCSSVSFMPVDEDYVREPKPGDYEIAIVDNDNGYIIIGSVSCQESASSSIWNWWTDNHALIEEMKSENKETLIDKIRDVGGDALIALQHKIITGGSSGGGVGLGLGVGHGPIGVGLGTSLLGSNPKIIVTSVGTVGVSSR